MVWQEWKPSRPSQATALELAMCTRVPHGQHVYFGYGHDDATIQMVKELNPHYTYNYTLKSTPTILPQNKHSKQALKTYL